MDATARARRIHGKFTQRTLPHLSLTDLYTLICSNKVPPRPAGQRTEPEPAQGFPGFGFGDNFHMSFGIGAFPFGFFTSSFNFGEPRPAGELQLRIPKLQVVFNPYLFLLQLPIEAPHSTMTNRCSRSSFSISPFFASVGYSLPSNLPARRPCNELQQ